jgi:hypothetical protein
MPASGEGPVRPGSCRNQFHTGAQPRQHRHCQGWRHSWRRPDGGAYRKILADRGFWIIGTAYLFVGFNVLVPFAFLPIYAKESLGLPYTTATRFVATIALFGILGQLTLGTLSDAVGRIRVMMLCGLIMGLACLAMLLSRSSWALYVASGCYGLGYGAVWPTYGAAASDFFLQTPHRRHRRPLDGVFRGGVPCVAAGVRVVHRRDPALLLGAVAGDDKRFDVGHPSPGHPPPPTVTMNRGQALQGRQR